MNDLITPEELNVALLKGVTKDQYRAKRLQYAAENGTTVAALKELDSSDLQVIRNVGLDPEVYRKQKLAILAEEVIFNT